MSTTSIQSVPVAPPRRGPGRPKSTSTAPKIGLTISDQVIPWSFVFYVKKLCHGDWDTVMDCFWKARYIKGSNGIQRYIRAGLKPGKFGTRYILLPSKERENGQMDNIREWFNSLYDRKRAPNQACFDIVNMLSGKMDCADTKSKNSVRPRYPKITHNQTEWREPAETARRNRRDYSELD